MRVACPHYACGVIQDVRDRAAPACMNCRRPLPVTLAEADADRRSLGLLAAMTLIAGLTWYITQKAL